MAQRSARRGRENQGCPKCFEHALGVMDPARELPYRPAADHRRIRGRTDGSIRLRATAILKFSLAGKGASTDGQRPLHQFKVPARRLTTQVGDPRAPGGTRPAKGRKAKPQFLPEPRLKMIGAQGQGTLSWSSEKLSGAGALA